MLHGQEDNRTDWINSKRLHEVACSRDKAMKLYPTAKHQLLQDQPETTRRVISNIIAWLDAQTATLI